MLAPVGFHRAESVDEACAMLQASDDALVVSGGTALSILLRQRLVRPELLIGIKTIPRLREIEANGVLHLGAAVSMRVAEQHPAVRQRWPLVAETLRHVATPRIRNMATIGGGLAHADPNQDPPPMFVALDARVLVASAAGERSVAAADFFVDYYETALDEGEIVVGVDVPAMTPGTVGVFLKYTPRSVDDYATVSAAAVVQLDPDGTCQDARLVLGAVGATPVVVPVADALVGQHITESAARAAAELARPLVNPTDDVRGSSEYKRDMAVVFGRRALLAAAERCPK
jgi:carbon-monoxide dehydrogenase medium subunit